MERPVMLGQKHSVKLIPEIIYYPVETVPIVQEVGRHAGFIFGHLLHLTRKRCAQEITGLFASGN